MKKRMVLIFLFGCLLACKEKPNYNPFDHQFNISVKYLIKDQCDTVSAECGYFNLEKTGSKFKPYYQVFVEDFDEVVAKGFTYIIDTVPVVVNEQGFVDQKILDSIASLPFSLDSLNFELEKFEFKTVRQNNRTLYISNKEQDTIELKINCWEFIDNKVVRSVNYFNSLNTNK